MAKIKKDKNKKYPRLNIKLQQKTHKVLRRLAIFSS